VHSTHSWCTVWKVSCFCAQYTFLMYHLESVLFLCTVHIPDVPSGKCPVSVHSTHSWCTVWKVFCFCAQYTFMITVWKVFCFCAQYIFLMYRLESVLFLCTAMRYFFKESSFLFSCKRSSFFPCEFTVVKVVPIKVETCNHSMLPYECDRYEIFFFTFVQQYGMTLLAKHSVKLTKPVSRNRHHHVTSHLVLSSLSWHPPYANVKASNFRTPSSVTTDTITCSNSKHCSSQHPHSSVPSAT